MRQLIAKLDIKIEQDWDIIRKLTPVDQSILDSCVQNNKIELIHNTEDHAIAYMGQLSHNWTIHSGPVLKNNLPWYEHFLELIKPLQYDGCGFQKHNLPVFEHADKLECHSDTGINHILVPDGQCKINYVIGSNDPDSVTVIRDRDNSENISTYGAEPNNAWLIDVNHPHYVKCNGYREVISFKFCEKFETVLNHFKNLGPLVLK